MIHLAQPEIVDVGCIVFVKMKIKIELPYFTMTFLCKQNVSRGRGLASLNKWGFSKQNLAIAMTVW